MRVIEHFWEQGCLSHENPTLNALPEIVSGLADQEFGGEAELLFEEDEDDNDAWKPSFVTETEVEARALPSFPPSSVRLGAMSVHGRQSICHYRGTVVCSKFGGYSMWVNGKLRRECPGRSSGSWLTVRPSVGPRVAPLF